MESDLKIVEELVEALSSCTLTDGATVSDNFSSSFGETEPIVFLPPRSITMALFEAWDATVERVELITSLRMVRDVLVDCCTTWADALVND